MSVPPAPNHSTTLDLWIGDVHELLPQWHSPVNGLIDAWFLDGFAPSKNPDMWTDALFSQMARLSKTGTTFGTFTAAGIVKRGLAGVGFTIKKRNGFGRKRDMLTGVFNQDNEIQQELHGPDHMAEAVSVQRVTAALLPVELAEAQRQVHHRRPF